MSTLHTSLRVPRPATATVLWMTGCVSALLAFAVRTTQTHSGLLYPDGYQYLLMARGLAERLSTTTRLGPEGDHFVPSLDAAAKPFFPVLIATADRLGIDPLVAARTMTTLAAASVVVLVGLLVLRLTDSVAGAVVASSACLVSPTLAFWSGFMGVDPIAQALALGAGLACTFRRPMLTGALAGLAVATRPEYAVIACAASVAALGSKRLREDATQALASGSLAVGLVFLVAHPTLALPRPALLLTGLLAVLVAAAGIVAVTRHPRIAVAAALAIAILLASGGGGHTVVRADGVLLVLAFVGVFVVGQHADDRVAVAVVVVCAAALAAVYTVKNPSSDRYLAVLIPMAAIVAGIAVARLGARHGNRFLAATVCASLLVAAVLTPRPPAVGLDAFAQLAPRLADQPAIPLVTATPDAYGWLLPRRSVRAMRAGERGVILLDGAQRLYAADFDARGREIAWVAEAEFIRPDGLVDDGGARLVLGIVVPRKG